jgi:hypothetical protein
VGVMRRKGLRLFATSNVEIEENKFERKILNIEIPII